MFKRLRGPTGEIADSATKRPDDAADKIVRSAILIHSGPEGGKTTLASSDGDISFDEKRIQNVIKNHNDMIGKLAVEYGGFSKMPVGAYPPILDQHADDSNDRIRGRLTGLLRFEKRSVPKVGDNVACAVCDITFLGGDTVKQVLDGRIYHLSVGIDESTDTLGETSTVIEPAAPGAMVLKKRRSSPARLKKKIKGVQKMSNKNLAKLQALCGELKTLSKKANATKGKAKLAKRQGDVKSRFTKLMAAKKMTPAEFKKLKLERLAKMSKEDFEDVMHVYEARETQIKSGQQGSVGAANFTDVGSKEDREVRQFKLAAKKNLSKLGVKFKESDDDKDLNSADDPDDKKMNSADEPDDKKMASDEDKDKKDLSEDGDGMGEADEADQGMEELNQKIEEQATQIARLASMVENIIKEMGGDDEEDKDLESDDDEDDKDLKSDDDKEDDKKDLEKSDEEKEKEKKEETK